MMEYASYALSKKWEYDWINMILFGLLFLNDALHQQGFIPHQEISLFLCENSIIRFYARWWVFIAGSVFGLCILVSDSTIWCWVWVIHLHLQEIWGRGHFSLYPLLFQIISLRMEKKSVCFVFKIWVYRYPSMDIHRAGYLKVSSSINMYTWLWVGSYTCSVCEFGS